MASIKHLKRDINYLTEAVVHDSLLVNLLHKGNEKVIEKIIAGAMDTHAELLTRVNKKGQKSADYKVIRTELLEKSDAAFQQLAALTEA